MNKDFMASYSDQDNCLVVRNWVDLDQPLLILKNLSAVLGLNEVQRGGNDGRFNGASLNISAIEFG